MDFWQWLERQHRETNQIVTEEQEDCALDKTSGVLRDQFVGFGLGKGRHFVATPGLCEIHETVENRIVSTAWPSR